MASIIVREQDILTVEQGIICHQVNLQGKMGKGIALEIRNKWPTVYEQYLAALNQNKVKLGSVQGVQVANQLVVANIFAQFNYGNDIRHINYEALAVALESLANVTKETSLIHIPYNMGCVNAGGCWRIVYEIIRESLKTRNVIICKKV
jgi:O-acetyl-ADP-ribose deacetylase (regulator of RNase III)